MSNGKLACRRDAEDRSAAVRPASSGDTIEPAVAGLDQRRFRIGAVPIRSRLADYSWPYETEVMQHSKGSVRLHPEDDPGAVRASELRNAIQIAVTGLDQARKGVRALRIDLHGNVMDLRSLHGGKGVQQGEHAGGCDLEDRARIVGAPIARRAIECPIAAPRQPCQGKGAFLLRQGV